MSMAKTSFEVGDLVKHAKKYDSSLTGTVILTPGMDTPQHIAEYGGSYNSYYLLDVGPGNGWGPKHNWYWVASADHLEMITPSYAGKDIAAEVDGVKTCKICANAKFADDGTCLYCALNTPRTQKGIGLGQLANIWYNVLGYRFIQYPEQLDLTYNQINYPCFFRPAPSQPRHGYLDSRVLHNKEQAKALLAEVLKDDPKGELIVAKEVKAKYSGILTPRSLVVGLGNDGATAGKNTATIPFAAELRFCDKYQKKAAKIGAEDWPYMELVQENLPVQPFAVQLRGGPAMAKAAGNHIPKAMTIKHILKADASVFKDLGWEEAIEKAEEGTAVWHPGGAMTDHFSIHAFLKGLPIIFDKKSPGIGDKLTPNTTVEKYDPVAMLRGFMAGEKFPINGDIMLGEQGVSVILISLHNATVMTGEASQWIGVATALMLRYGITALRGEARHLGLDKNAKKMERQQVYSKYITRSMSYHRASLNRLINVFRYGQWPSSGFGGPKWACCGASIAHLFNAIRDLAKDQTPENASKVVEQLNLAVNQAHNGGWWLNKFTNNSLFDTVAKGGSEAVAAIINSMGMFAAANAINLGFKDEFVEKRIQHYASWPDTTLAPPYTSGVSVHFQPGIGAIRVKLSVRLLKSKMREISANVPVKLDNHAVETLQGNTYLIEGADGYKLEVRLPDQEPMLLWEEPSLAQMATKNNAKN